MLICLILTIAGLLGLIIYHNYNELKAISKENYHEREMNIKQSPSEVDYQLLSDDTNVNSYDENLENNEHSLNY